MRALVCEEFGPPDTLKVKRVPRPRPGPGQVLISVEAAGINFTDLLSTTGRSQLERIPPFVPGVEAAGRIAALGPGTQTFRLGDRVLCTVLHGAHAEFVIAEEDEAVAIPDSMPMAEAACFYVGAYIAWHSLVVRAAVRPDETLLVVGAGSGAGLMAIQAGKALGARVVAAASCEEKLELSRQAGADECLQYPKGPLVLDEQKELTRALLDKARGSRRISTGRINSVADAAGFDVIYDAVGGSYAEPAMRALAWEGRYLSVGFAAGVPKLSMGPVLFKNASIFGIQPSEPELRHPGKARKALETMFSWYEAGDFRPIVSRSLSLENAYIAFQALQTRASHGRTVITMEHDK